MTITLTVDLGFGDAGKGSIVDFLARQADSPPTVVRYNGGAQAAHNVVTADGRHHTFAQFGAGMFVPGTRTHLSQFMLVAPPEMMAEARHLESLGVVDPFTRTTLDRRARVITPYHQAANRLREVARGDARHGSCGMGIGETASDHLTYGDQMPVAGDLADRASLRRKLEFVRETKRAQLAELIALAGDLPGAAEHIAVFDDETLIDGLIELYPYFASRLRLTDADDLPAIITDGAIFEGAQGVLLDEDFGFHPYTTWSHITLANADAILRESGYAGAVHRLGIVRAYAVRHGAGPFPTEDTALTAAIPDPHNGDNPWQRAFRIGWFDAVLTRYALKVGGGVDALAVTCLDRWAEVESWKFCDAYQTQEGETLRDLTVCPNPPDLDYQETLTRLLERVTPIYTPHARDQAGYLAALEGLLGVSVAITSSGLTAEDKQIHPERMRL